MMMKGKKSKIERVIVEKEGWYEKNKNKKVIEVARLK